MLTATSPRRYKRSVVPVTGPNPPHERLTITPKVIACARTVFLLVTDAGKDRVLAEALESPVDFMSLPVRLTMCGLLDNEAERQLLDINKV